MKSQREWSQGELVWRVVQRSRFRELVRKVGSRSRVRKPVQGVSSKSLSDESGWEVGRTGSPNSGTKSATIAAYQQPTDKQPGLKDISVVHMQQLQQLRGVLTVRLWRRSRMRERERGCVNGRCEVTAGLLAW